jgi:hypothetical protein
VGDTKNAGRLFLAINDDVNGRYGKGYKDNQGSITVQIVKKVVLSDPAQGTPTGTQSDPADYSQSKLE